MKWLFRIIGLTLFVFICVCVAGAFMPAQQRVDASTVLDSDVLSVYELLSDLRSYPEWSGVGGPDSQWVFGGADIETGQTAAWQAGERFGALEIMQTEPGQFVVVKTMERDLDGFPYLGRIASIRQKSMTKKALEQAVSGLAQMVES